MIRERHLGLKLGIIIILQTDLPEIILAQPKSLQRLPVQPKSKLPSPYRQYFDECVSNAKYEIIDTFRVGFINHTLRRSKHFY